jgi:L-ribulose-5-phosphate 3-epimerase
VNRVGIMQGRLLPPFAGRIQCFPAEGWDREFALAAKAGLDCIEWIYDLPGENANPLASDDGIAEMGRLVKLSGVPVLSLCADYFMERPLLGPDESRSRERRETLAWLMRRSALAGIGRIVLPFVDASEIRTPEELDQVAAILEQALPVARECGLELHLETSLTPARFADLLGRLPESLVKVNYDSGNSASLGYDPREELAAYGQRIGSVHIKDRVRGGGTVPLGTGDTNFKDLFGGLRNLGYRGDFILQVARGREDEVERARRDRAFVRHHWPGLE